jgi:hypothetical protein
MGTPMSTSTPTKDPRLSGPRHVGELLLQLGWHVVTGVVTYGCAVVADRDAAQGAKRALTDPRRVSHDVAAGLKSLEGFLAKAAARD